MTIDIAKMHDEYERMLELLKAVRMYEAEPIYQGKMFVAMKRCADIEPEEET